MKREHVILIALITLFAFLLGFMLKGRDCSDFKTENVADRFAIGDRCVSR